MEQSRLLYKNESYRIMGADLEVHKTSGPWYPIQLWESDLGLLSPAGQSEVAARMHLRSFE